MPEHQKENGAEEKGASRLADYHDQCFLMDFMKKFIDLKGTTLPWAPQHVIEVNKPSDPGSVTFMNKLTSPSGQALLENVPELLMESIQPTIKLYKVRYEKGREEGILLPLPFNNVSTRNPNTGDVTTGTYSTTAHQKFLENIPGYLGVNLVEFSFDYEGVNPAEVDYYIRAKLVLYCASVDAFFHEYKVKGKSVSFADLIKRPTMGGLGGRGDTHLKYDENYFRIFAEISYEMPPGHIIDEYEKAHPNAKVQKFFKALQDSKMSFFLNILKHEVKIDSNIPTGPFTVEIDYVGAVETALYNPSANVLEVFPETKAALRNADTWAAKKVVEEYEEILRKKGIGHIIEKELADVLPGTDFSDPEADKGWVNAGAGAGAGRAPDVNLTTLLRDAVAVEGGIGGTGLSLAEQAERYTMTKSYFEAKEHLNAALQGRELDESRIKTERYTRLLHTLYGKDKEGKAIPGKASRIYNLTVKGTRMIDWVNSRAHTRKIPEERLKTLKERANQGIPGAHEELQKARDSASSAAKNFNAKLWGELNLEGALGSAELNLKEHGEKVQAQIESDSAKEGDKTEDQKNAEEELKYNNKPQSSQNYSLEWFYFGDLIDAAIEIVKENENLVRLKFPRYNSTSLPNEPGNTHLIFGPCVYNDFTEGKQIIASLAKIPISLKLFHEFWMKKVIKPQRPTYPFHQFLKDALLGLVGNSFTNRCAVPGEKLNRVRATYDHTSIALGSAQRLFIQTSGYGEKDSCPKATLVPPGLDPAAYGFGPNIPGLDVPQLNFQTAKKNDQILFVYANTNSLDHLKGKKYGPNGDVSRGIFHIELGRLGVPIKEMSFSKADIPFYLEAKGERSGLAGNPLELSEPYNVTFKTLGSTVFKPGRHFYLVLPHFGLPTMQNEQRGGMTAARMLGLGGYFMANKISNVIRIAEARVDWYSDVEAIWVSFADNKSYSQEQPLSEETSDTLSTRAKETQKEAAALTEKLAAEIAADRATRTGTSWSDAQKKAGTGWGPGSL